MTNDDLYGLIPIYMIIALYIAIKFHIKHHDGEDNNIGFFVGITWGVWGPFYMMNKVVKLFD